MKKVSIRSFDWLFVSAALAIAGSQAVPAQKVWTAPTAPAPHAPVAVQPAVPWVGGDTSERSLKVDGKVNLQMCVTQGTVNVNSWHRNELRVFVHDGSKFGFKVLQKNDKGDPVWVAVVGTGQSSKHAPPSECIAGGEIEIDLPAGAAVSLKGQETDTTIDSIRKASVKTVGGDITLRNIAAGVSAGTYEGDITVERSKGSISLESSTGNIVVFEAGPSEIGDSFKAKTNGGLISLQSLDYRQMEVNSISGTVAYNGPIITGGSYNLSTTNGTIRLAIPNNSACTVNATFSFGRFETELPFKIVTENVSPGPIKTVVGTLGGGGDALITLISNNGTINIKKQ